VRLSLSSGGALETSDEISRLAPLLPHVTELRAYGGRPNVMVRSRCCSGCRKVLNVFKIAGWSVLAAVLIDGGSADCKLWDASCSDASYCGRHGARGVTISQDLSESAVHVPWHRSQTAALYAANLPQAWEGASLPCLQRVLLQGAAAGAAAGGPHDGPPALFGQLRSLDLSVPPGSEHPLNLSGCTALTWLRWAGDACLHKLLHASDNGTVILWLMPQCSRQDQHALRTATAVCRNLMSNAIRLPLRVYVLVDTQHIILSCR